MSKFLSISLIVVALIVGIGLGYILSSQYAMLNNTNMSSASMDLGSADKQYDLRFVNAMIAHHMGAIDMAEQAQKNSTRNEIKNLAKDIITAQTKEIDQLYKWKKDWYNDSSKVEMNDYSMQINLGSYDEKFDLRFINAMIGHHEGAIDMAMDAQKKSSRNEILNLADDIEAAQSKEIGEMKIWRNTWYGIK